MIESIIESSKSRIIDSGDRTQFASGAVRDMREGKGRCDLLPLDVAHDILLYQDMERPSILFEIYEFQKTGVVECLHQAIQVFVKRYFNDDYYTMLLEVAKHFEEGAKKYGDDNWRKGIPVNLYVDSAVRHYLKFLRGDKDEPHNRAFCWNILCGIWTATHMPELNPYRKDGVGE